MDLLNSILNSMDKPPSANEQQRKLMRKQREMEERMRNKQKEELNRFRKYVQERVERFSKDERPFIEFQPLDKVHRAIIHEVAEYGGFIAMSFGREDVDRYSVVYKKENAPSEDEISARRNGDGWNEEIAQEYAAKRKEKLDMELEHQKHLEKLNAEETKQNGNKKSSNQSSSSNHNNNNNKPVTNYKDKYAHLIGQDAALEAARKTETNKSYGFVPSKNKKDMRSIEQTLADIQAKKRRKLQQQQEEQEQLEQQLQEEEPAVHFEMPQTSNDSNHIAFDPNTSYYELEQDEEAKAESLAAVQALLPDFDPHRHPYLG